MIREKSSGQRKNPGRTPIFKRKTEEAVTKDRRKSPRAREAEITEIKRLVSRSCE